MAIKQYKSGYHVLNAQGNSMSGPHKSYADAADAARGAAYDKMMAKPPSKGKDQPHSGDNAFQTGQGPADKDVESGSDLENEVGAEEGGVGVPKAKGFKTKENATPSGLKKGKTGKKSPKSPLHYSDDTPKYGE